MRPWIRIWTLKILRRRPRVSLGLTLSVGSTLLFLTRADLPLCTDLCVSAALDAVKERVVVPWASTSKPTPPDSSDGTVASDATVSPPTDSAETPAAASVEAENESLPSAADDVVPPPAVVPRILYLRHFTKALKEITPSSSEVLGSLADLRKWNEEFGEGRGNKKRQQVWGKGLFGFTEKTKNSESGRVVPMDGGQR